MGISMCCSAKAQMYDTRFHSHKCPFQALQANAAVIRLPLLLKEPPSGDSIASVPNSILEEYNAKLRVGHKLYS